jgi:Mn-dependent DtxR family transcriptional regulator
MRMESPIILSLSKKEFAEKIGVQRTSVSRELAKMRREGLIQYDRQTMTILEMRILD